MAKKDKQQEVAIAQYEFQQTLHKVGTPSNSPYKGESKEN